MKYEPNRDREQPVEATRDGFVGEQPLGGSVLPVGGPGNDPDTDKLGDEADDIDERGPDDGKGHDPKVRSANVVGTAGMAGTGPGSAPFIASALAEDEDKPRDR